MATDDEVRAYNNVRERLAGTQADLRVWIARAQRAEAAISSVRALLDERRAGKFWYVRVADVLAALDSTDPESTEVEFPQPCQPIGCDNGFHLPGCPFEAVDAEPSDAPAPGRSGEFGVGEWVLVDVGPVTQQRGQVVQIVRADDGSVWEYDVRVRDGDVIAAQPKHVHADYTRSDSGLPVDGETT